jgi:outer membrane usher protein FimD/PapC
MGVSPANAIQFNPMFLKDKGANVDLRFFEKSNGMLPGSYIVDLYLNQRLVRRQNISFGAADNRSEVEPVLSAGLLREMGWTLSGCKKKASWRKAAATMRPSRWRALRGLLLTWMSPSSPCTSVCLRHTSAVTRAATWTLPVG